MGVKQAASITDVLKNAVIESGISYKALSRETGVARASIQRFVDGRQSIRLDMADRLAAFFGLNLVERKTSKPGREAIRSSSVSKAR
jgi:plasmid maintenance system antidote protein VapI